MTKKLINNKCLYLAIAYVIFFTCGCKKIIQIDAPVTTITSDQVFSTNEQAASALAGIYFRMVNSNVLFLCSGATSVYCGMSSDELISYDQVASDGFVLFQKNNLSSLTGIVGDAFWTQSYSYIYGANAVIEGLQSSKSVSDSVKIRLTGEAKFIRAFCYFYLINLFGDVPLTLTVDFNKTALLPRTPVESVYKQIINDLIDAQNALPIDYSAQLGERVVPIKWAASALLARVYLYHNEWENSEVQASAVIEHTELFNLATLDEVFSKNSSEAIWQLQPNPSVAPFNITTEGNILIPIDSTYSPFAYFPDYFLNSFEPNDERKNKWIKSFNFDDGSGTTITYYYPFKYNQGPLEQIPGGNITQYYMVLRLAEQYLIRAEARAKQNKLTDAIEDLNFIRHRANLPGLSPTLAQEQVVSQVEHERKVELFVEWGHRWLDLKRTGKSDAVLGPIKGGDWNNTDVLYPIPLNEIRTDPNLTQNKGY